MKGGEARDVKSTAVESNLLLSQDQEASLPKKSTLFGIILYIKYQVSVPFYYYSMLKSIFRISKII